MPQSSYGAAVVINDVNAPKLSILTGIAPQVEDKETIFVYPYNPDASCEILTRADFDEKYSFANTEDPTCLVDIDKK